MKKNVLLLVLLVFLIVMNGVLLFLVVKKPNRKPGPPRDFIVERLDFNEEQLVEFAEIDETHHQKMRAIDDESRRLKGILFTTREENRVNIDSIGDLIGTLAKERELEVHHYFKRIEQLCDDKQKLKLKRIVRGALRPGPPHGRPPHDGPPPRR